MIKNICQKISTEWIAGFPVIIPFLIISIFAALTVKSPSIIDEHIETLLVDYRFKIRNLFSTPKIPEDILIVAINEESLERYGRWPWSRKLQAKLIEMISKGKPRVVAIDIIYPESESYEADNMLADVIRKYKDRLVIALGFEVSEGQAFEGEIEDILYDQAISRIENYRHLKSIEAYRVLLPPKVIADSATFGHTFYMPDRDGKLRWENLYIKYGDEYFPSFALQTARIARGTARDKVSIIGGAGVDLDGLEIPTDEFGRLHINYLGKEGTIIYYSAMDVLSGRIPDKLFRDKIVFIGATAMATYDQKITPLSANMPGVEKNATVVANILDKNFIKKAPLSIDLLAVLLAGIAALFIHCKQKALQAFLINASLIVIIIVTNLLAFIYYGMRINLVYPLLTVITSSTFIIGYRYFLEERKAGEIRRMFSNYATERIVSELIRNPDMAKLGGERREVTVLFADIRGFTSFSEKHAPEEVVAVLNEYLSAMTDIIFSYNGTIDKFIGDAILVFWGAPVKQPDHTELAVRCSLEMIQKLKTLQQKWQSEGKDPLDIGIGINTGYVLVGNIGAEGKKMDYTVIGDHVNLCERVESLTKKYNAQILITEFAFARIAENSSNINISVKDLGTEVVKGKAQPVRIYELKPLQ